MAASIVSPTNCAATGLATPDLFGAAFTGAAATKGLGLAYFFAPALYKIWSNKLYLWRDVGKFKVILVTCQLVSSVSTSTGVEW